MYRRRRVAREQIAFGFDCFLDLVANVIGVIIRLILVAWVGGRSYHALMEWTATAPDPAAHNLPALKRDDDPLARQIAERQRELDVQRAKLLEQMKALGFVEAKERELQGRLTSLQAAQRELSAQERTLQGAGSEHERTAKLAALSLEELRRRQTELRAAIKEIEGQPAVKKVLRYRTPVSRAVHADEVFFECQNGRVTFIDLPAFLQEIQSGLDGKLDKLRTTFQLVERTAPVGAFRLRYVVERQREGLDEQADAAKPNSMFNFRYGVAEWSVEPVTSERGETLAAALAPGSAFRRVVERLDPSTVVTFWVYADSFAEYRALRDFVVERGVEVAGRPLPPGAPIAASRHGSASRGQ